MKSLELKFSVVLIVSIGYTQIYAQEGISTSGGNIRGSGGSVSYTVGQTFYTSSKGADGSIIQGVQQPYEIIVNSGASEIDGINLFMSTYPNPTNDFIQLFVENETFENFKYELYDIKGHLLENKILDTNETFISMRNLPIAVYFLKVKQGEQEVKTFKIIKN
jgi:hypothetical protein